MYSQEITIVSYAEEIDSQLINIKYSAVLHLQPLFDVVIRFQYI